MTVSTFGFNHWRESIANQFQRLRALTCFEAVGEATLAIVVHSHLNVEAAI